MRKALSKLCKPYPKFRFRNLWITTGAGLHAPFRATHEEDRNQCLDELKEDLASTFAYANGKGSVSRNCYKASLWFWGLVCICVWLCLCVCVDLQQTKARKSKVELRQHQRKNGSGTNWATGSTSGGALEPTMPPNWDSTFFICNLTSVKAAEELPGDVFCYISSGGDFQWELRDGMRKALGSITKVAG